VVNKLRILSTKREDGWRFSLCFYTSQLCAAWEQKRNLKAVNLCIISRKTLITMVCPQETFKLELCCEFSTLFVML
jgi:hypothetical protein